MPNEKGAGFNVHEDADLFAEAINFTAATTGFAARLIEKDYFASVLLRHLCSGSADLVFKGGTCLSKVYWDLSRLSEDLDFSVAVPPNATRGQRRAAAFPIKQAVDAIPATLPVFRLEEALRGFNVSTQYVAVLSYESQIVEEAEKIKLEIGFREPLLRDAVALEARTLLLDPVGGEAMVPAFAVRAMAELEACAEKARAALTRREPAVRDFDDFDYAVQRGHLQPEDADFVALVRQKLAMPGNEGIDVSDARRGQLVRQLEAELRPVLRPADFDAFAFDRAFARVMAFAGCVS
jgi:predicted nucleotidyltransferase component of viral defense system